MPVSEKSICSKGVYDTAAHECDLLLGEGPFLTSTIRKFADAAARAGISLETLIDILESGVPMEAVFDLIQVRLESRGSEAYLGTGTVC